MDLSATALQILRLAMIDEERRVLRFGPKSGPARVISAVGQEEIPCDTALPELILCGLMRHEENDSYVLTKEGRSFVSTLG